MGETNHPRDHGKVEQTRLFSEETEFACAGPAEIEATGATLFTIGHSTRPFEDLIRVLDHYRIERLADIRQFPSSRHNPQFNQPALREGLSASGIEYLWLKELGGYREGGYLSYMETADFSAGVARLESLAREKRTACMCAELKWYQCHRRRVADVVEGHGWTVVHIVDESRAELHRLKGNGIRCD